MHLNRVARPLLYVLLAILAIYHVTLQRVGAFAWPDEYYYLDSVRTVEAIASGNLGGIAKVFMGFSARPAANALWLVPASVQVLAAHMQSTLPLSRSLVHIPTAWNPIVSVLLVLILHRLALWFYEGDELLAAAAAATYALLPSNQLWTRHVVPYDLALVLWLTTIYVVLSSSVPRFSNEVRRLATSGIVVGGIAIAYPIGFIVSRKSASLSAFGLFIAVLWAAWYVARGVRWSEARNWFLAGALAGVAVSTYPAYYSFGPVIFALVALSTMDGVFDFRQIALRACSFFVLGTLAVMTMWEVVARLGDVSYFASAARVAGTIVQGNFEDGWVFLPKYLVCVDGATGAAIIMLFTAYCASAIRRWRVRSRREAVLFRLVVIVGIFYVAYGFESVVLHKMTFTGRYVRMYIPVVVMAGFASLRSLSASSRRIVLLIVACVSVITLSLFARDYSRAHYPIDELSRLRIGFDDLVPENRVSESTVIPLFNYPVKSMMPGTRFVTHPNDRRFALVNFAWFALEGPDLTTYSPPPNATLLFRGMHFQCLRTSYFEGIPKQREEQLNRRGPCELKVYDVAAAPAGSATGGALIIPHERSSLERR